MYRETIQSKKAYVIIKLVLLLSILIYGSNLILYLTEDYKLVAHFFDVFLIILSCFILASSLYKTNIKYKYSIIADQLIIHKIVGYKCIELKNIKIKDVMVIKKQNKLKLIFETLVYPSYTCSMINMKNIYCCIYYANGVKKRFYFEPSKKFIYRLEYEIQKDIEYFRQDNNVGVSIAI